MSEHYNQINGREAELTAETSTRRRRSCETQAAVSHSVILIDSFGTSIHVRC
jgi:hypothetical protein